MKISFVDQVHRLGPRALAAVIRRSVLSTEVWLRDGEYRPFVDEFARACDAVAPWFALGHDPDSFHSLNIDAVEPLGSFEEQQSWSPICVLERAQEAHRLAVAAGEEFLEAQAAGTIGNAWFNMGDFEKSVEWYERAVETQRNLGNQRALGSGQPRQRIWRPRRPPEGGRMFS